MCIYIYIYILRGWLNTVETVLFEMSHSMRPYPSVFHACTRKLRPAIGVFEPRNIDEASNRIPPTSQTFDVTRARAHELVYLRYAHLRMHARMLPRINIACDATRVFDVVHAVQ